MRFTFTLFKMVAPAKWSRGDITTNRNKIPKDFFEEPGNFVSVCDNLGRRDTICFYSSEALDAYLADVEAGAAQARQCLDNSEMTERINKLTLGQLTGRSVENAKNSAGSKKAPLGTTPPIALIALGAAMDDGAKKYGPFNWRPTEVTASVFFNAMARHLLGWYCGEREAADSGIHHLAHLMGGAAIVLDAEFHNVLVDDRPKMPVDGDVIQQLYAFIRRQDGSTDTAGTSGGNSGSVPETA